MREKQIKEKGMDRETLEKYAPFAVVIIALILQWNLFVTPSQLEVKHREILQEISQIYATKETSDNFKAQLNDIQKKIDKIYDIMANK